ncbi:MULTISPECIES: hypothetical protein [Actinomycetes]|jgi:hypothetical protein|uniref:hypothetical protein n=1 Tax=Actinomycetes TaxID=1760 RepID=UPI0004BFCC26|nr:MULTISPECIES: hypothetical protein [Actinomycetes]
MHLTTTVWAADLPPEVSQPFITLGGYFLTLLNFFALCHLIFLGASIAYEKVKDRPMADIGSGEWATKIIVGVWISVVAGDIAAVALS